jgi:LuxR family transcriptional regulator, maltose regulon positive regulatory protein
MAVHAAKQVAAGSRRPAASDFDTIFPIFAAKITDPKMPDWALPRPRMTKVIAQGMGPALHASAPAGRPAQDAGIPQPCPGAVGRGDLINTARSSGCRVIAVTSPAGYGKSTFLAQWAAAEDRRVAWVSLDRFDQDPAKLLVSLASAYCRAGLGGADLIADMGGPGVAVLRRAAPRLAAEFRASRVPFVLMLDDLHELHSTACHDALNVVISGIPDGSQLAIASRFEQPHLPRLRASGEALEFGPAELTLDAAAAQQIFANAQVRLTPEQAATVTERTEGWPAGLADLATACQLVREIDDILRHRPALGPSLTRLRSSGRS